MPNLLKVGDFSGAITLLLQCLSVAAMFNHFTCVAGLSGKLQDTLEMTEEHLDIALAKVRNDYSLIFLYTLCKL